MTDRPIKLTAPGDPEWGGRRGARRPERTEPGPPPREARRVVEPADLSGGQPGELGRPGPPGVEGGQAVRRRGAGGAVVRCDGKRVGAGGARFLARSSRRGFAPGSAVARGSRKQDRSKPDRRLEYALDPGHLLPLFALSSFHGGQLHELQAARPRAALASPAATATACPVASSASRAPPRAAPGPSPGQPAPARPRGSRGCSEAPPRTAAPPRRACRSG